MPSASGSPRHQPPPAPLPAMGDAGSGDMLDDLLRRLNDAESKAAASSSEIEHLQRLAMLGTISASVIHEINNLLTPALSEAQRAHLHLDEPDRLKHALEQCILSITQAARISQMLMDFAGSAGDPCHCSPSRDRSRPQEPCSPSANIARAFKSALAMLGSSRSRRLNIETRIPPNSWAAIDPVALQQVFLNLLLNAIKALRDTPSPRIRISAEQVQDQWEITVEDNGPGIPAALHDKLFQPFASGSATGTGLGLAVCKRLIEQAGGTIAATSSNDSSDAGARFTLRVASICRTSAVMSD